MNDSQIITLLRLCHELSQIHEMPANHSYSCPIPRMTHEIYKFHLACLTPLDSESLTSLCESFKTCYTCFVLSCKQSFSISHPMIQTSGEAYLQKLLKDSIQFVQELANEAPENVKLVAVGKFCETVEKVSEVLISIKSFFWNQVNVYKELMQSAVEDVKSENEEDQLVEFCEKCLRMCERVLENYENTDERKFEQIIAKCKDASEDLDNLVCCLLTDRNEDEVDKFKRKLELWMEEIRKLAGLENQ